MVRISRLLLLALSVSVASCTLEEGDREQMVNLEHVKDDPVAQLENLNAAIERSPRNGSLYARRAVVLLRKDELQLALDDANKAVKLTRNEPSALFVKAQVLRALGKPDEALPLALSAERNSYQSTSLYVLLGELYLQRGDIEQAMKYIRKAQDLSPTDEFAYYYKGRVLEAKGDTARAMQNYKLALQQVPTFMEPQRELASLLVDRGEYADAQVYLTTALKAAPKDAKLWYTYGLSFLAAQKSDSAIYAFRRTVALNSNSAGAHYQLGVVEQSLGNNDAALEHLQKAYESYKDKPQYLGKLAVAYERLGLYSKALVTYQRLVELEPNATYAYQAMSRVKYKIAKPMPDSAAVRLQEQIER